MTNGTQPFSPVFSATGDRTGDLHASLALGMLISLGLRVVIENINGSCTTLL
jgi:hypothetical protein